MQGGGRGTGSPSGWALRLDQNENIEAQSAPSGPLISAAQEPPALPPELRQSPVQPGSAALRYAALRLLHHPCSLGLPTGEGAALLVRRELEARRRGAMDRVGAGSDRGLGGHSVESELSPRHAGVGTRAATQLEAAGQGGRRGRHTGGSVCVAGARRSALVRSAGEPAGQRSLCVHARQDRRPHLYVPSSRSDPRVTGLEHAAHWPAEPVTAALPAHNGSRESECTRRQQCIRFALPSRDAGSAARPGLPATWLAFGRL